LKTTPDPSFTHIQTGLPPSRPQHFLLPVRPLISFSLFTPASGEPREFFARDAFSIFFSYNLIRAVRALLTFECSISRIFVKVPVSIFFSPLVFLSFIVVQIVQPPSGGPYFFRVVLCLNFFFTFYPLLQCLGPTRAFCQTHARPSALHSSFPLKVVHKPAPHSVSSCQTAKVPFFFFFPSRACPPILIPEPYMFVYWCHQTSFPSPLFGFVLVEVVRRSIVLDLRIRWLSGP